MTSTDNTLELIALREGMTPGPWQVNGSHVYGPDPARHVVCQTLSDCGRLVPDRDAIAALPALLDRLIALDALAIAAGYPEGVEAMAEGVKAMRAKFRATISHATGGAVHGDDCPDFSQNELGVRITQHVNRVWEAAQEAALKGPTA